MISKGQIYLLTIFPSFLFFGGEEEKRNSGERRSK